MNKLILNSRAWPRKRILEWITNYGVPESSIIFVTALLVGIGAGLGAVVFRRLIEGVQTLSFEGLGGLLVGIAPYHLLIIPALGGMVFGPLIYFYAREAKGHGVPEVMEAVALRGGRIRPRVAVVKSLASAICIGTGGSVGREGPIAQIGSALGSTVGQWLKLSEEQVRTLVACGAAGGIAATFNAPIAGSLFALEVILNRIHSVAFGAVVISAVVADVIAHIFEGDLRAFPVPEYTLVSPWELGFYVLLGVIAAVVAFAFTRLLYFSEDLWEKFRFPEYFKPVLGAVLLGLLGLLTFKIDGFPRIFGVGYASVTGALFGELTLRLTLSLLLFKLLATILTLGSGGSGGVFAPSLFMGAMMGEAFGKIVGYFFPAITAPPGAYALVGMSAFFSGAAHAPITAILILFEMTGNYQIILPLMLTTVVSTLVAQVISRESIYTLKLTRRGIHLQNGQNIDVMQGVTVAEAMSQPFETVTLEMPLPDLIEAFERTHHHGLPVVDHRGNLAGVVSIRDVELALKSKGQESKKVVDIATTNGVLVAYPNEPMWMALRRLGRHEISVLPIVKREAPKQIVGVIRRRNVVHAYNQAVARQAHHQHRTEALRIGKLDGAGFFHVDISPNAPVVGRRVNTIPLPPECLLVSVRRKRKLRVVHGDTVLEAGDRLTVFAHEDCIQNVHEQLTEANGGDELVEKAIVTEEVIILPETAPVKTSLQDLLLPPNCILAGLHRGGQDIDLHSDLVIEAGDVIKLIGETQDVETALQYLNST
ncbi:MAG: chloride channel protein [Anaerolineales bacterium]